MKLRINSTDEFRDPDVSVTVAAIKELGVGESCTLDDLDSYIDTIRDSETEYRLQYLDSRTDTLMESSPALVDRRTVLNAFTSFLAQDGAWKGQLTWRTSEFQPDPKEVLEEARLRQAVADADAALLQLDSEQKAESYLGANVGAAGSILNAWLEGPINPHMVCPHCGAAGVVHTREEKRKAGVSGGKATAALLTAGLSLWATGLSRKEAVTRAHCSKCDSIWHF